MFAAEKYTSEPLRHDSEHRNLLWDASSPGHVWRMSVYAPGAISIVTLERLVFAARIAARKGALPSSSVFETPSVFGGLRDAVARPLLFVAVRCERVLEALGTGTLTLKGVRFAVSAVAHRDTWRLQ
jgi:hypothetical protein